MDEKERNIVLIGMPGCGKSTIGKILADRLDYKYIDSDCVIEEKSGKSIEELFKIGENHFRKIECKVIREVSYEKRAVISTGGGVIKNSVNVEVLKENGIVVFIDRPIENIASDINMSKRPLLKEGTARLYELYKERYELYKESCDIRITNDTSVEDVVKRIEEFILER